MKRYYFARVLFICWVVFTTGCTPAISNKVSPEEYELYSAWTAQHFAAKTPDQLFFLSRTFVFDPLERYGCGDSLHGNNGVPWSQIKRLHALGEAEYPLDFYTKGRLDIPWPYKEVDSLPLDARGTYRIVGFSRVAFNRDRTEGLFAISDSCGGLCGGGGARPGPPQEREMDLSHDSVQLDLLNSGPAVSFAARHRTCLKSFVYEQSRSQR